jgi:hypothetical protein
LVGEERTGCLVGAADDVPGEDRRQHPVLVAMDDPVAELGAAHEEAVQAILAGAGLDALSTEELEAVCD